MTALDFAREYIGRGWAPIPIPRRQKGPILKGWTDLRITQQDAPRYFNGAPQNIGILLGAPSAGLVDVDLDCPEAVSLAPAFLPPTDSVFGRASKRRSHWLYVAPVQRRLEYTDPDDGECLVELRSSGGQTVFPGSTHESGESVEWHDDGDPAECDPTALISAVGRLATACVLVRAAPAENRHGYMVAISGALVRALGVSGAAHLLAPAGRLIFGDLYNKADESRLLSDTARKIESGSAASGWPTLIGAIGEKRARKLTEWLGLPTAGHGAEQAESIRASAKNPDQGEARAKTSIEAPWPSPLADQAFHGIAGEIVRRIEPESEADPSALLFQFLAAAGNILGPSAYARVEADRHPPRLFVVQVGRTSKGRKGTSWGRVRSLLETAAPEWTQSRVASGLSSGEGVIFEVRDEITELQEDKKSGEFRSVVVEPGVADKRLLVFEGEFAKALRSIERQGNTLSAVLRDCWDHGSLRTLIKNNANRATGAHVSIVGHITGDELRRYLDRTEVANGLANRLIFVCVERSKLLPRGGRPIDWSDVEVNLRQTFAGAPQGEILRTEAAWQIWESVYSKLSADRPGMLGAILGRAEAQVLRLAVIYALLDRSAFIEAPHMLAALACWDYAEASARFVFGDALGDPVADEILRALRSRPDGMTRTELMHYFGRNLSSDQIGRALAVLAQGNFIASVIERTTGRPAERWRAVR